MAVRRGVTVPAKRFYLKGNTIEFCPQTRKLECRMRLYHLALTVGGLLYSIRRVGGENKKNHTARWPDVK